VRIRSWLTAILATLHSFEWIPTDPQKSKRPTVRVLVLCGALAACFCLFLVAPCRAQTTNVTTDQATPTPGVGHDYIHMLTETVDPASGSLSVRIHVPVPKSLGFTMPFSFAYNSNGVTYPTTSPSTGIMYWQKSDSPVESGGWTYTVPYIHAQKVTVTQSHPSETCSYFIDYMFNDPSGGRHALGLSAWSVPTQQGCTNGLGPPQYLTGRDDFYRADANAGNAFARTVDADGTLYDFPSHQGVPDWVEDRNGNKVTYSSAPSPFISFTDSSGRTAVSVSSFAASGGDTVTVSGLSNSYHITWGSVSYGYTPGGSLVFTGGTCSPFVKDSGTHTVITSIELPNGKYYYFYYDSTYGLLDKIVYPSGGWVKYTWGINPTSQFVSLPNTALVSNQCWYHYGTPVVTKRQVSFDGSSVAEEQDFGTYTTTWNSSQNWTNKSTTVVDTPVDTASSKTVYTYGYAGIFEQPNDEIIVSTQVPVENQILYKDGTGSTLRTVNETWGSPNTLSSRQTILEDGTTNSKVSYTYPCGLQNPSKVETNYDGTTRTTTVTCATGLVNSAGFPIWDKPSVVQVLDGSTKEAETDYAYDSVNANTLSVTRKCISGSGCASDATTQYSYDDNGQNTGGGGDLTQMTDPKGYITHYGYTCSNAQGYGTYLSGITYPDGTSASFGYDCASGRLTSSTDQNSQTTSYSYSDSLGRLTGISYPDGGVTSYSYNDSPLDPSVTVQKSITSSLTYSMTSTMDGLGHTARTEVTSDPAGPVYTDMTYDGEGQIYTQSNPYRSTSDPTYGISKYDHDALGRLTKTTYQDGSSSSTTFSTMSNFACATTTDPAGKTNETCSDALGRLREDIDGLGNTTTYGYNALDNLISVTQGGQSRSFTYDSLSRLISATNPESRTQSYAYDPDGNMTSSTDARGITISYSHDNMDRLTGKTYSDQEPAVSYTYSQSNCLGLTSCYNVGRRTGMTDGSGSTEWAYDKMGTVWKQQKTIGSATHSTSYTYNLDGSMATLTYPSGHALTYAPDAAGQAISLTDSGSGINYVKGSCAGGACYAPQGALASVLLGQSGSFGGITVSVGYNNRLWPASMVATSSAGTELSLAYSYLANGDVQTETNNRDTGRTASYTYDSLNRLITGSSQATSGQDCWGASYGYDQYGWGNLLNITTTKCQVNQTNLSLNSSNPSSNQISGWSYDAAGNTLNTGAGTESYTWNAEERMATVASSLYGDDTYVYDGDGERVEKASGKLYWRGAGGEVLAESDLGGNITAEYVFFDGERLARIAASGSVDYYLSDKLGSSAVVTDASGAVQDDSDFLPFGDELDFASSSGNTYKYTGLERDADQLDHTLNRQYSSNFGRWMTPDPGGRKVVKLDDPQTWNMYAYVGNNPTSRNDPSGLQSDCANGPDGSGCSSNGESFEESSMHFSDGRYGLDQITDLGIGMAKGLLNMLISTVNLQLEADPEMQGPQLPEFEATNPTQGAGMVGAGVGLLFVPGAGEEAAAVRASELAGALGKSADFTTTAVTETEEGVRVISSSEPRGLRPAQRAMLREGEIEARGGGHAEVTGVNKAREMGLTPTGVAASRPICPACVQFLRSLGVEPLSLLK